MKNYIFILILCVFYQQCSTQTEIINIKDQGKYWTASVGQYYKDIDNELDYYNGTWLYNNGNKSIKLVLTKKVKLYNGKIYDDVIVGGVEYKESNIVKVNSIANLNNNYNDYIKFPISGNSLVPNYGAPKCFDCQPNELRLRLSYHELNPDTSFGTMILRKIVVNGQDAIKMSLKADTAYQFLGEPEPISFKLPVGEYIFIKQ